MPGVNDGACDAAGVAAGPPVVAAGRSWISTGTGAGAGPADPDGPVGSTSSAARAG